MRANLDKNEDDVTAVAGSEKTSVTRPPPKQQDFYSLTFLTLFLNCGELLFGFELGSTIWIFSTIYLYGSDSNNSYRYFGIIQDHEWLYGFVAAAVPLGTLIGLLLLSFVQHGYSSRMEINLGAICYLFATILILFASLFSWSHLYTLIVLLIGRIFYGIGSATSIYSIPHYMEHILPVDIRNVIRSIMHFIVTFGMLIGFTIGYLTDLIISDHYNDTSHGGIIWIVGYMLALIIAIFMTFTGFLLLPEDPIYLLSTCIKTTPNMTRNTTTCNTPTNGNNMNTHMTEEEEERVLTALQFLTPSANQSDLQLLTIQVTYQLQLQQELETRIRIYETSSQHHHPHPRASSTPSALHSHNNDNNRNNNGHTNNNRHRNSNNDNNNDIIDDVDDNNNNNNNTYTDNNSIWSVWSSSRFTQQTSTTTSTSSSHLSSTYSLLILVMKLIWYEKVYRIGFLIRMCMILCQSISMTPIWIYYSYIIFAALTNTNNNDNNNNSNSSLYDIIFGYLILRMLISLIMILFLHATGRKTYLLSATSIACLSYLIAVIFYPYVSTTENNNNNNSSSSSSSSSGIVVIGCLYLIAVSSDIGWGSMASILQYDFTPREIQSVTEITTNLFTALINIIFVWIFPIWTMEATSLESLFITMFILQICCWYFIYYYLPETKNLSREQISYFVVEYYETAPNIWTNWYVQYIYNLITRCHYYCFCCLSGSKQQMAMNSESSRMGGSISNRTTNRIGSALFGSRLPYQPVQEEYQYDESILI
jgi:MFS family permease